MNKDDEKVDEVALCSSAKTGRSVVYDVACFIPPRGVESPGLANPGQGPFPKMAKMAMSARVLC